MPSSLYPITRTILIIMSVVYVSSVQTVVQAKKVKTLMLSISEHIPHAQNEFLCSNLITSSLINYHNPQTDASTWTDVTSTLPSSTANPPVNVFIASSDRLNPSRATSTAKTEIVVSPYVRL